MEMPPHMTNPPHAYQLKGASQADFCCEGPFALFACGDGMGVGKTLLAILAMWLRKDEPGFSLVVTPKTLCRQWVEQIEQAWEEVSGPIPVIVDGLHSCHLIACG